MAPLHASPPQPPASDTPTSQPQPRQIPKTFALTAQSQHGCVSTAQNDGLASRKLPLVVYFHGGQFICKSFDETDVHDYCNNLALSLNVVIASASYRLAPENKLPAAYDDGVDVVEWLRNSNDKWIKSHADLSNVFLMGRDSGGNVAYNVGLRYTDRDLTPLRIRGLILHKPFFGCQERSEYVNSRVWTKICDICWEFCLPDGTDRDHEYSNPRVTMELLGRLGWRVMVYGSVRGTKKDGQIAVVNLMKEKGVDVIDYLTEDDLEFELESAYITSFFYSSSAP